MIERAVRTFRSNPKALFRLDAFGAGLSAFLLGFVLVKLRVLIGMPRAGLYLLAAFPILFMIIDIYWMGQKFDKAREGLRMIGLLNIGYCVLSLMVAYMHSDRLTLLGWLYIAVEIVIVFTLARIELKVARKLR